MTGPRSKFWGWGTEDQRLSEAEEQARLRFYAEQFGVEAFDRLPVPALAELTLPRPRVAPPAALAALCSDEAFDRVCHSYGKSLPDYVRIFDRDFAHAPDLVAFPHSEDDVAALLDWAAAARVAVVPFGGGSSVVGGVEPAVGDSYAATLSLDLGGLDRVLEVDDVSRAARLQAGLFGPALEAALKRHGLTLRHFPQSFEFSTVGGWIKLMYAGPKLRKPRDQPIRCCSNSVSKQIAACCLSPSRIAIPLNTIWRRPNSDGL